MRLFLTVAAVMAALSSLALAQAVPSPSFGQPGSMAAMTRYGGKMLVDPIFLAVLIVILLIASRFLYWLMIPAGGVIAAITAAPVMNKSAPSFIKTRRGLVGDRGHLGTVTAITLGAT